MDKFSVLIELLVQKGYLEEGEFLKFFKDKLNDLGEDIRQQYKDYYK